MKQNKKAFSLIELLLAILVFIIWIISVYAIIRSTTNINMYNKDYIIASSLAREQIELVRNIRDTNFAKIQNYKIINPSSPYSPTNIFKTGAYYKIENDFWNLTSFSVKTTESVTFLDGRENLLSNNTYRVCLNSDNLYVYCDSDSSSEKTPFYKYIKIEEVPDYPHSFKVISRVAWNNNWYHTFDIISIFTDYKIF